MFEEIDKKYYYDGNDLGAVYSKDKTVFKLWAPLAQSVTIKLYHNCTDEKQYRSLPMSKGRNGVFSKVVYGDLDGVYYTYCVVNDGIEEETIDIYAKSAGVNGIMGMVVDFDKLNPAGWDSYKAPLLKSYTDAVVYELHVRDFSIDKSGNFCYKGRFLAFTESGIRNASGDCIGIDHLKELGVTHVQLMPCFDFYTVDESAVHKPQFNWGYDPMNFNVPEGSYSTNPYNGASRVAEFKRLINALHSRGISVIMDVVYNHTSQTADSCFTKTFPLYYYRQCDKSFNNGYSNGSGCGNELATERLMVRKYIIDSLVHWAKEYKIDGFRFDLMGLYDYDTINQAEKALHEINPSIIMYGEGWQGGLSALPSDKACMKNLARNTPRVGYFSDDFRDTVKGSTFKHKQSGYVNGSDGLEGFVKQIMTGRVYHPELGELNKYCWTDTPQQAVNYVEAHDNLTIWDKLFYTSAKDGMEGRIKMDKMCAAMVFLAQGIPFIQAGQEFLRSKPLPGGLAFDDNSYCSPDVINSIKWEQKSEHKDVYLYYKGLIEFRKAHSALRMSNGKLVADNMKFISKLPAGVVGFVLTGDDKLQEMIVFLNPQENDVTLFAFEKLNVYIDSENAGTEVIRTVEGNYTLSAKSVIVLGKPYDTQSK